MQTASVILVVLLGVHALPLVAGAIYQPIETWRDRRRFLPPGRLVRVNERRMHIRVTGEGAPTVVFESGMGASCLSWTLVQPQVAQYSRAVSYDRAGHGWSDPAPEPRTARQIAQELNTLLNSVFNKLESFGLVSKIAPPNNFNIMADYQNRFVLLPKGARFVAFQEVAMKRESQLLFHIHLLFAVFQHFSTTTVTVA